MLQITAQHHLYIAVKPVDFRKGIDGLAAVCRKHLQSDPFKGTLFIFRNRRGTAIKLLIYDGNGFWLCQKRFSAGKVKWWPANQEQADAVHAVELLIILAQGKPQAAKVPEHWHDLL